MSTTKNNQILKQAPTDVAARFPVPLVCPVCREALRVSASSIECEACGREYEYCNGFPDLIYGGRFDDPTGDEQLNYEERCNADTTRNYLLPLFNRWWPAVGSGNRAPRLLSLGCGTGIDIDILTEAGYDAVGIDCGNRTKMWAGRHETGRLMLANGKYLPFEDGTFDGIFCGCVFPHVGVVGDSFQVAANYGEERLSLAREMARVLKPDGKILVSSPNRHFPFDIFHGRGNGGYRPVRYNSRDPFLLSLSDYRTMFKAAGCAKAELLPVDGYWGFIRSKNSMKGYLLSLPVRLLFRIGSVAGLKALRGSAISPWIVVLIEK